MRPCWQTSCPEWAPYPIDRHLGFDIKEGEGKDAGGGGEGDAKKAEGAPSPGASGLSAEEVASGRLWSARVVLVSGMNAANLEVRARAPA